MKTKVALMVVYNHRYDRNIPTIEDIYKERFKHIYHIVPFYDGTIENVLPVYDNSFYFQGYIAQAYEKIKHLGYTHFYVIADDLILNPSINENSLWNELGIREDECFHPGFLIMQKRNKYWSHAQDAVEYTPNVSGVEIMKILPSFEQAKKRFEQYGIPTGSLPVTILKRKEELEKKTTFKQRVANLLKRKQEIIKDTLNYPLVGGYSDTFLVTADVMPQFVTICGAFAATKLFVELAIPTAMVLSSDCVVRESETKLKGMAIWTKEELQAIEQKYDLRLDRLLDNFPKQTMYIHPIKLSRWGQSFQRGVDRQ